MRLDKKYEDFFSNYIAARSISAQPNEVVVAFVNEYFIARGWETEIIPSKTYAGQSNFRARLVPAEAAETGDLVLTGHLDTVAPVAEDWDTDPFSLTYQDGVYFGNGVCDTKGPTATAILAAVEMCTPEKLTRPVSIWLNHSEENRIDGTPLKGSKEMAAWAIENQARVDAMVVLEPTKMQPIHAHNGQAEVVITVKGKAAHSSVPELGVNAIEAIGPVVTKLATLRKTLREKYDMPLNIGFIEGGRELQINVVAENCRLILDFRCRPNSITADDVLAMIHELLADSECTAQWRAQPVEPLFCDAGKPVIQLAAEVSGKAPAQVAYYTDADEYRKLMEHGQLTDGLFVFGCGDIAYAHAANEQIDADEIQQGIEFFKTMIHRYCMQ